MSHLPSEQHSVARHPAPLEHRFCRALSLQLLHGSNVARLDVVLEVLDLLLELLQTDLVILDDNVDLQLLDTEGEGHQLGSTPDQTVLLDTAHGLLQGLHVGLVVYNEKESLVMVLCKARVAGCPELVLGYPE